MKKMRNRKFIIGLVLIIIVAALAVKFFIFSGGKQPGSTKITKGNLTNELTLSGAIDADEHVILQFQTGGLLSWVGVKEGDHVQQFQGIASLDVRQLRKTLDKTLNDYMTTRWNFEQQKDDNKNGVLYGQQSLSFNTSNDAALGGQHKVDILNDMVKRALEKSQFQLNNAVLDVELQDIAIQLSSISTPISGVVIRIDSPYAGVNIIPTQAQFEIVNPKTVFLNVTADQTEVVNLKGEQKGEIILDSYPGEKLQAKIKSISFAPKANETGTVYEIKIELPNIDNSNYKYRLGMTGDITFIISEKKNVLYVPLNFIKNDNKGKYITTGAKKEKKYIQTGFEGSDNIEIKGDIKEGDVVYD